MSISVAQLQEFERVLDPLDPPASPIPCSILGYGEISTVLQIDSAPDLAAKRMPLFASIQAADKYAQDYASYCNRLRSAGLNIPEDTTLSVQGHQGITVLYILQKKLPPHRFCHNLIHTENSEFVAEMAHAIVAELEKVWRFNSENKPGLKLAIDGQLSNWVLLESGELLFIDTSTPLMLENGVEILDPELLLQSAPSFMRWLIRWQFLKDVMNRYYDPRLVYTDLIANLFKEQCSEMVPEWINIINAAISERMDALDMKQIESYYKEDKLIWQLFLGLRRLDRFIKTKILGQRYEFVLPGNIKR